MSRLPMAGVSTPAAPMRAAMLRAGPVAKAPTAKRPRAMVARTGAPAVHKARPIRKASVHGPAHKKRAVSRRIATGAGPVAVPIRAPTPMAVAAVELATPVSYALISSTICETTPTVAAVGEGPPTIALEPPPPTLLPTDEPGEPPFEPLFPIEPGLGPDGPGLFPPTPPIEPPVGPPTGPPVIEPPVTPVPEPAAWALMIVGFGLLGARLRRATSSAASGCPGRAGRRG